MKLAFLFAASVLTLAGCGPRMEPKVPEVEKAAKTDSRFSIKRYDATILDKLYYQELEKRVDLKKLEDDIRVYNDKEPDSLRKINTYLSISSSYYAAAKQLSGSITDSMLKKSVLNMISASEARFSKMAANDTLKIKQLAEAEQTLNNQRAVLKLMVTLPVLEKYQRNSKPETKIVDDLIKERHALIDRTKKLAGQPK